MRPNSIINEFDGEDEPPAKPKKKPKEAKADDKPKEIQKQG